jgi:hypothetical protein
MVEKCAAIRSALPDCGSAREAISLLEHGDGRFDRDDGWLGVPVGRYT